MDISIDHEGKVSVVKLGGSVDALGGPEVSLILSKEIDQGNANLVLEMSGVTFISSAGVRMLLNGIQMARQANGDVRLANLPLSVTKVLEIGGLVGVVQTFDDAPAAVRSFTS